MKKKLTAFFVILGILILTTIAIQQIATAQSLPVSTITDPYRDEITLYQKEILNSTDEKSREFYEEKLRLISDQATQWAIGVLQLTEYPDKNVIEPVSTLVLSGKRETGIIENPPVAFSTSDFLIENAWQEKVDGEYILIFAGALTANPKQGILLVITENPHRTRQFLVPGNVGSVKITEVKNLQLVLHTQTDTPVYFDVPGRAFISNLGDIVPTVTPSPDKDVDSTQPGPLPTAYP